VEVHPSISNSIRCTHSYIIPHAEDEQRHSLARDTESYVMHRTTFEHDHICNLSRDDLAYSEQSITEAVSPLPKIRLGTAY
jgi:hypothetical protein